MAMTAAGVAGAALVVKALPMASLTTLASSVATSGGGAAAGAAATCEKVQNWLRAMVGMRSAVDHEGIMDFHAMAGLTAAQTYLQMMVASGDREEQMRYLYSALHKLVEGRDALLRAGALSVARSPHKDDDAKSYWAHLMHTNYMLICVTYWRASRFGEAPQEGLRVATPHMSNFFQDFVTRRSSAQSETFYTNSKTAKVDEHWQHFGMVWVRQLETAQQQGFVVNLVKDAATGFIVDLRVPAMVGQGGAGPGIRQCQQCGVGAVVGAGCSNPACSGALNAVWSWRGDQSWIPYSAADSRHIELANIRGQMIAALAGGQYEVDIPRMKQRRKDNHNRTRDVQRTMAILSPAPASFTAALPVGSGAALPPPAFAPQPAPAFAPQPAQVPPPAPAPALALARWEWKSDTGWRPYHDATGALLEAGFRRFQASAQSKEHRYPEFELHGAGRRLVDLKHMYQVISSVPFFVPSCYGPSLCYGSSFCSLCPLCMCSQRVRLTTVHDVKH
jgi:hypothetical protein